MNIRAIHWFALKQPLANQAEQLEALLDQRRCRPCPGNETETLGWTSPFGEEETVLCHSANGYWLLSAQKESRLLPASVVQDAVKQRAEAISASEGRPVGRKEKQRIKDEVHFTLLPKAFVKKTQTTVYIDTKKNLIAVCCSSRTQAEQILTLLRNTMGSLIVLPITTEIEPGQLMSEWLLSNNLPGELRLGADCEMIDQSKEQGSIRFSKQSLIHDSVLQHLKEGKVATQLGVFWQETVSFTLNKDLSLTKIKWLDLDFETGPMDQPQDAKQALDASFVLMTGIMAQIFAEILTAAGGLSTNKTDTSTPIPATVEA